MGTVVGCYCIFFCVCHLFDYGEMLGLSLVAIFFFNTVGVLV